MNRNKLLTIGLVLAVLFMCVGAVSAADIADDAAALTIDDSADAVAIEDAPAVVEADAAATDEIEQVNENVDKNLETLESSSTSVNADNWTALRDYSQKTDSNYVITLTGNEYTIGNQIQFRNNATIIGTPGSYITGGSASTIPFIETSTYNKNSVNFINITFKDITCKMLIQAYTTGTTTIENCTFTNVTVGSDHCSVVYNSYGNMNIIGSNFTNCSTSYGAVTNYYWNPASVKMNVTGCRFEGNTASSEPGAINNCGIMNVTDSTFIGNHADLWAGAIHTHSNAQTRITGSEFTNNSAVWGGGALFSYSVLEVYDSTFTGNSGLGTNGGGAISGYNFGSTYDLTVSNCTFIQNEAVTGGAISVVNGGNLNVCNSTFINNAATTGQAIASATVVVDENSTGSPTTTIENNEFYNHTQNTADTVYITGNNYVCNYNTFNNSYQTPLTGTGNIIVNVPGSSSLSGLTKSRILKSARPSDKLGDIETIVVHNDDELYAAFDQLYDKEGIIELAAGTYHWDTINFNRGNITFIGQGSETILLPFEMNWFNIALWGQDSADEKIGRNFKNLVIKNAFIEISNDVSFENVLFDNVVFNIGLQDYYEHIMINTYNPSEVTYYVKFNNCNFTNTQEVIETEASMGYADQIGQGEIAGYLYQSNFMSLAEKTYYMFAYPHNDINIVNCTFSNIALDVLVFVDTDFGYLNIENSVFKDCTYGNFAITKTSTTDYVNINNCWYDSDVVLGFSDLGIFKTAQATDSYAAAKAVQNENVVYDGETLNDFTVKLVSVNAEGVESDFDATGFPSIPVTFTVDGVATESAFVDGIATLSVPLTSDQAVITATVGSKVLTFTLPAIPRINDDNYADYFDEEGNFVYEIEDGATIILGTLTNKNIIFSQPLNIKSNDDSSVITNCTITLTADASGSTITGLKMVLDNVPAGSYPGIAAIALSEGIHDVVLKENSITWVTADSPAYSTAMGIEIIGGDNGVSSNIELIDNEISISGDAPYMYGIDCYSNPWNYEGGAVVDLLAQGNKITLDGSGMVEGIYLSHVTDSVVKNNIIEIESAGGNAYGVGTGNIHDVNMEGNTIVAKATAEGYNATGISLYQSDINEKLNDITVSGSTAQKIGSDAESAIYAIVDNDNYNQYFDESGNYINEAENITLADLSNKDLTFGSPVNVKGAPGAKLNNVTIKLTADASGSTITGLEIVLDNVPAAAYPGLAVITLNEGIQDVVLEGNSIQWVTANSPSGATAMGIAIIGGTNGVSSNIQVNDNEIAISGDASNIYGIDCYSDPWDYDGAIVNLVAQENKITLNGTGFVEGIYLSHVTDSVVKNNIIEIESAGGNAYGVGTDNIHDVTVGGNTISATTTAEGKTAAGISLYQSDIIIDNNIISASGSNTYGIKADNKSAAYIVADGNKYIVVDENNYNQFFDESGNYINNAVDCIALADLSNKDLTFASPISVKGVSGAKLTNVTFTLTAEASDSVIDGLTFDYEGASNVITLNTGIENVAVINNNITFKSTGYYMAAIVAGHYYSGPATSLNISSNNINVTCDNAVYGIDIMGEWGKLVDINSIISDNNIAVQANGMAEGIYLTGVSNCMITNNNIITNIVDTGDSIGIGVDGCNNITISDNVIEATSKQAAFGIANSYNTDNTITNNNVKVAGASAIGIGLGIDTGAVIEGNTIDVTAGDDYATTPTFAGAIGTGNSGIKLANNASADINGNHINSNQNNMDLAGASSNTKVGTNYVKEYIEKEGNPDLPAAPAKTTITVQSATVTADPNGKSKTQNIAITVKDAKGNAVAGQTIQVYVNGALKTAKTNDKGVATLAVPYKAGGTTTLVASFNGATGLLGSSATGKLTVKKNAVKIAAKTKKVKKSKAKKAKVQITVKAGKTALKKKLVTITINKKTYKAKTNAKGIATFKVKLPKKAKKYKYTIKFAGDNFNNAKTFKGKLTVK